MNRLESLCGGYGGKAPRPRHDLEAEVDQLKSDLAKSRGDVGRLIEQLTDDLVCLPEQDYDACRRETTCTVCWQNWLKERP